MRERARRGRTRSLQPSGLEGRPRERIFCEDVVARRGHDLRDVRGVLLPFGPVPLLQARALCVQSMRIGGRSDFLPGDEYYTGGLRGVTTSM